MARIHKGSTQSSATKTIRAEWKRVRGGFDLVGVNGAALCSLRSLGWGRWSWITVPMVAPQLAAGMGTTAIACGARVALKELKVNFRGWRFIITDNIMLGDSDAH